MDGSELVFILMPIAIPLCLAIGVAAPFVADSLDRRRQRAVQAADWTRPVKPS